MTGGRGLSRATLLLFALMGVAGSESGPRPGGPIPEPEPEPEPELLRARLAPRPIPIVPGPYLEGGPPAPPDETRRDEKKAHAAAQEPAPAPPHAAPHRKGEAMRPSCQTIAALLLTLLPRCGVVELGCAPAYGRASREGVNVAPERPAEPPRPKRRKAARKVPGKRQPPLQPPVGPGVC